MKYSKSDFSVSPVARLENAKPPGRGEASGPNPLSDVFLTLEEVFGLADDTVWKQTGLDK